MVKLFGVNVIGKYEKLQYILISNYLRTSFLFQKLKVELRGPDNGLRVRQVKILGQLAEGRKFIEQLPGRVLRAQMCEAEVLKVFKLLTAEVSKTLTAVTFFF